MKAGAALDERTVLAADERTVLAALQEERCFYCGKSDPNDRSGRCEWMTIDHFIASSRGGDDDISNMVLACWECNQAKANRKPTTEEYERHIVLLLGVLTILGRKL